MVINRGPTQIDADFFIPIGQKYHREATTTPNSQHTIYNNPFATFVPQAKRAVKKTESVQIRKIRVQKIKNLSLCHSVCVCGKKN